MGWLLLAQAGVGAVGSIYNMFANANNADEQARRAEANAKRATDALNAQRESANVQAEIQKGKIGVAEKNLGTDIATQSQTIAQQGSAELASRVAAGQTVFDGQLSSTNQAASQLAESAGRSQVEMSSARTDLSTNMYNMNQDINRQLVAVSTDLGNTLSDIQTQKDASFWNGVLNLTGTAIGAAAGIADYQSKLAKPESSVSAPLGGGFDPTSNTPGAGQNYGGMFDKPWLKTQQKSVYTGPSLALASSRDKNPFDKLLGDFGRFSTGRF